MRRRTGEEDRGGGQRRGGRVYLAASPRRCSWVNSRSMRTGTTLARVSRYSVALLERYAISAARMELVCCATSACDSSASSTRFSSAILCITCLTRVKANYERINSRERRKDSLFLPSNL